MVAPPSPPWSVLVQLLGEHHQDAAGAMDIGELVDVSVGGHAAQRMAAVPRCDLEGLVDVVYREGDGDEAMETSERWPPNGGTGQKRDLPSARTPTTCRRRRAR